MPACQEPSFIGMRDEDTSPEVLRPISLLTFIAMLWALGKRAHLHRAPGPQGRIKRLIDASGGVQYMDILQSRVLPFPTTMKVRFDQGSGNMTPPLPEEDSANYSGTIAR